MPKNGQAKVLSNDELDIVLAAIETHRYPAKNAAIVQTSFKLGLRVQELALLRLREVCQIESTYPRGFELKDTLVLPKSFTKGARAMAIRGDKIPVRTSVRFPVAEFDKLVQRIARAARAGRTVDPTEYYPPLKPIGGRTRELPLSDTGLITALKRYLDERALNAATFRPNAPLFLSQKGGPYSPNTLQDHIATMYRAWAGIERATSHSGRRTLATKLLHDQGEHLKTVQQVLGHKDAATTTIYQDVPEEEMRRVLHDVGESYER